MPVRACVCVWAVKIPKKKNFFFGSIWRRRSRKLFNTLYCCCCCYSAGCPCLKWLGLFFSSYCKIFCKSAMHELRLLNVLSLSHTRAAAAVCACALSRALSLFVCVCLLALWVASLSLNLYLWHSPRSHLKFVPFVRFFFSCKTKIQHISFVAFSFRYNFNEFKCIKTGKCDL